MKLIPEWRTSWRFWSMQVAAAVAAAPVVWSQMPPEWRALVPDDTQAWFLAAAGGAMMLVRVLDQGAGSDRA